MGSRMQRRARVGRVFPKAAPEPKQIRERKGCSSIAVALVMLSVALTPFEVQGQESAGSDESRGAERAFEGDEEGRGNGETGEDGQRLALRFLPLLRVGLGPGITPGQQQVAHLDCDVAIAGRLNLIPGRDVRFEIVPELGYVFHSGELVGGHYGTVGLGFRTGSIWVAGSTVTTLLLGSRDDTFDIGIRAGLRLEVVLGLFGLEVAYESRGLGDQPFHGLHVVVTFDAALLLMPMLLTRMGWSLGGRT